MTSAIWVILFGGLALMAVAGIRAFDRRAGFLVLGGLAVLLSLGVLLAALAQFGIGSPPVFFGVLLYTVFLPAGVVLFFAALWSMRSRPAARDRGLPAPVLRPEGPHQCPDCGANLPANAPEGLCPRCLLRSGLAAPSPTPPAASPGGTTPHPGPLTAPTPAELAGRFPQLAVLELIGQGGMGAVYKARQTKLDRVVALKVLPPEWGSDPAFAERFAREARTLAKLNHPHVVAVHDFGEAGGLYYLVMEHVDGPNLREVLQAGQLAPEQTLAIVPQICDALQYAHEEEVVHRDIKPENILLDRRGRVKIADFGLAKLLNRPRAEFTLTGSRQVMGTLDYMAPEQRHSPLQIDHRADIYSLGVVFYEMLTGALPLGRFAPPSQKAAVDARLDEVVFRALETDPEQRYQSVSAVKADVESIAGRQAPATDGVGLAERGQEEAERQRVLRRLSQWMEKDTERGQEEAERQRALRQVRGPALGLLLVGVLTPLAWVLALVIGTLLDPRWLKNPDLVFASMANGPSPMFYTIMILFSLLPGAILVARAVLMRKCRAYELVFLACQLAMSPYTTLFWFLSLPVGVWAILVLGRPHVRAAFASGLHRRGSRAGLVTARQPPQTTGPVHRRARAFLRSVRAMFFTTGTGDRS
jgi:tRNA A-37 threonylcarbamoyl transferase component Bud32